MNRKKLKILVVEDDKLFRLALVDRLKNHGEVIDLGGKNEAIRELRYGNFDIAFIDLKLGENFDGLEIISIAHGLGVYGVVLSGHDEDDIIEQAYENGCQDFFEKGNEEQSVMKVIDKYYVHQNSFAFDNFISNDFLTLDQSTINDLKFVFKNSSSDIPMFFSGATGTGKTSLASLVHKFSGVKGEFVQVNCSEINSNLIESELFGHKKGAFTGAIADKVGRIKQACGGTLFLDEICSMSIETQTKLLKVLEEKEFYPVGSDKKVTSNFRIICASQDNIFEKIQTGEFRQDLYYRISGINLRLKPLRERPSDISLLINKFIKGSRRIVVKSDAMEILSSYRWPGNVRELIKVVEILLLKEKGIITASDLPPFVIYNSDDKESSFNITEGQYNYAVEHGIKNLIIEIEKQIVEKNLIANNGKVLTTLKELRLSRTKFYKIKGES